MELPKPKTRISVRVKATRFAVLSFTSPVYQHQFEFDVSGQVFTASDNFFDLYPGQAKAVEVDLMARVTPDMLRKSIRHRSLADTY
jgi:beta-mannosidase